MKTRFLKFMAEDTGGGGGTAVIEPTLGDAMPEPFERWEKAMKEQGDAEEGEPAQATEKPKKAAKAEKVEEKEAFKIPDKKAKPESPLDAAVADEPVEEPAADPELEEFRKAEAEVTDPKKLDNMKRMRERIERDMAENSRLKKEFEAAKEQAVKGAPDVEALRKENAELRDAITAINVEYDPAFRAEYIEKPKALMTKAEGRVEQYGGDVKAFRDAMTMTGKNRTLALREALADVDPLDLPRIASILEEVDTLNEKRTEQLSDPQGAFDKLQQQQRAQAQKQAQERDAAKEADYARISSELPKKHSLLRTVDPTIEGGKEWNETLKTSDARARHLVGPDATFEEVVEAAKLGARYPQVEKLLLETRSALKQLKEELSEYKSAEPSITAGKKPEGQKYLDPADRFEQAMAALKTSD